MPAWYEQNLNDPARIAAVEGQAEDVLPMDGPSIIETPIGVEDEAIAAGVTLDDALLPSENDLPAGQPQAVPEWAGATDIGELYSAADEQYDEQFVEEAAAFEEIEDYGEIEIPDWLKEVETTFARGCSGVAGSDDCRGYCRAGTRTERNLWQHSRRLLHRRPYMHRQPRPLPGHRQLPKPPRC